MATLDKVVILKLLNSENYLIWTIYIRAALMRENINIESLIIWEINNKKVFYFIQLFYTDKPLLHIKNHIITSNAWIKLKELYNPFRFIIKFLFYKEFFNTSLNDFNFIKLFLNKVREIINQLKSYNI